MRSPKFFVYPKQNSTLIPIFFFIERSEKIEKVEEKKEEKKEKKTENKKRRE